MAEIKFCGLTRPEDAQRAMEVGAGFLGVVFAESPRRVDAARATAIFAGVPASGPRRVGVFAGQSVGEIARTAEAVRLDVIQLHDDPDPARVTTVRGATGAVVWAAVRIEGPTMPAGVGELFEVADGILLDARTRGALGGTGIALDWPALAAPLAAVRRDRTVVLAGGLRPENVTRAIAILEPEIVDVSSGVEVSPGIKDAARMRAFARAVRAAASSHAD